LRLFELLRLVGHGDIHIDCLVDLFLLLFFLFFLLFFFGTFDLFERLIFFEFLVSLNTLHFDLLTDVLEVRLTIEQLKGTLLHT
jgi:hypothetical protein